MTDTDSKKERVKKIEMKRDKLREEVEILLKSMGFDEETICEDAEKNKKKVVDSTSEAQLKKKKDHAIKLFRINARLKSEEIEGIVEKLNGEKDSLVKKIAELEDKVSKLEINTPENKEYREKNMKSPIQICIKHPLMSSPENSNYLSTPPPFTLHREVNMVFLILFSI